MSANTFNEALELAYAEAWRQGEYLEQIESGEVTFAWGEEGKKRAYDDHWRESLGAQKVLGVLLHAKGLVGRKGYPADPENFRPDIQQVWIRLMQWGIAKGLTTEDKLYETLANSPQHAAAMRRLGQDAEGTDYRTLIAEQAASS